MHRFYLPPSQCHGPTLSLRKEDAHHALRVLRMRVGQRAVVLDGQGRELLGELHSADRRSVTLAVKQINSLPALPYRILLLQAIPKAKAMETIIQKATELGVSRIVPILSERSVIQIDSAEAEQKVKKWEAVAIEALKQCGAAWLPMIDAPCSPDAFLARGERFDLALIASLQPNARHPRRYFEIFHAERRRLPTTVAAWIGPEGDYTPAEINRIRASGAYPITLGQLVLRSETAAIYCLSILNYELQAT